jgi:hypothetical protein
MQVPPPGGGNHTACQARGPASSMLARVYSPAPHQGGPGSQAVYICMAIPGPVRRGQGPRLGIHGPRGGKPPPGPVSRPRGSELEPQDQHTGKYEGAYPGAGKPGPHPPPPRGRGTGTKLLTPPPPGGGGPGTRPHPPGYGQGPAWVSRGESRAQSPGPQPGYTTGQPPYQAPPTPRGRRRRGDLPFSDRPPGGVGGTCSFQTRRQAASGGPALRPGARRRRVLF